MNKTLFLLSTLQIGGSERRIINIANALADEGIPVELAYLNPPEILCSEISAKINVTSMRRKGKFSLSSTFRLKSLLDTTDVSTILCVNLYPMLYAIAARALRSRNRPKILVSVNTTDFRTKKEQLAMLLYEPLLKSVDRIIFGSHEQQRIWQRRYHVDPSKCSVIHNGVDSTSFHRTSLGSDSYSLRKKFSIPSGSIVVGTVGQLRPEKQQRDLIEAMATLRLQYPRLVAVLVGGGPEIHNLQSLAAQRGLLDNVRIMGETSDVRPALTIFDIFVNPSLTETFSNAALEAMAMTLPTILSDVGGAREMLPPHRYRELLYPAGDVAALAIRIRKLIESAELRCKIGQELRENVVRRFGTDTMIEKYRSQLLL